MSVFASRRSHICGHLRGIVDVELDQPPDVHVAHAREPERRQRALDRLPLRVEDPGLRADEDADAGTGQPVRASHAPAARP
jgi:hypothetical protein